jgi:hypothetical protein
VDDRRHLQYHAYADTNADAYTDTNAHTNAHTDSDAYSDANADADANRHEEASVGRLHARELCKRFGLYPYG